MTVLLSNITSGTVANASITTSLTGLLKGTGGGAIAAATSTDVISTINSGGDFSITSGNLGLGCTPSAWNPAAGRAAMEFGIQGNAIWGYAGEMRMTQNVFYDGNAVSWKTPANYPGTIYEQNSAGAHNWYSIVSGGAGAGFTLPTAKMTLDASGNLGIGAAPLTNAKVYIQVTGTTTPTNYANVAPNSINLYNATAGGSTDGTTGIFGWQASGGLGSGIGFSRQNSGDWGTSIRFYVHPTPTSNLDTLTEVSRIDAGGNFIPTTTATYNLGSATNRWANIYTSDLNLNNGIGNYTIVEGEDDLFLYNNKSGKTYKFVLQEVDPSIVPEKQ